jgi:tRNA-dihydrouridine synthase B
VRSARKHIGWYVRGLPGAEAFRQQMNTLETADRQWAAVGNFLDGLADQMDRWPVQSSEPVLEMEL